MNARITSFKEQCKVSISSFEQKVFPITDLPHAIAPMDAFAFCAMGDMIDVDMIIESGLGWGASTEIWSKYFNKPVFSIDSLQMYGRETFEEIKARLKPYSNIVILEGDSFGVIPKLILGLKKNIKIGLYIDGPKSKMAVLLAQKCFMFPRVKFVGIHSRVNYHEMDFWDKTVFYADAPWFVKEYSYLNYQKDSTNPIKSVISSYPMNGGTGFALQEPSKYQFT